MSWFVFVVRLTGELAGRSDLGPIPNVEQLQNRPLGRVLIKMGRLTRETVHHALARQVELKANGTSKRLGEILVEMNLVSQLDVDRALCAQRGERGESDRDAILGYLRNHHIGCSNYFPPIHLQPFYMKDHGLKRGDFPITEHVAERTIALPFHTRLTRLEIENVVHHLKQAIAHRLNGKE